MAGAPAATGLTASELRAVAAALLAELGAARVIDVARLRRNDDLLLFLQPAAVDARRVALHIVPGGRRGRITLTSRRFARDEFASGPLLDALRARLAEAVLDAIDVVEGERIVRLRWRTQDGSLLTLVAELFGNRGFWCLLDAAGRIVDVPRLAEVTGRALRPGDIWAPPPPAPAPQRTLPQRFARPLLVEVDAAFTAADLAAEADAARAECARALERARRSLAARLAGLAEQATQAEDAPRLRARADLLLAYAHLATRGATAVTVPDPDDPTRTLDLPLDPALPVPHQAKALYARARRIEDAQGIALARRADAERELARVDDLAARLGAATDADIADLRTDLVRRGLLRVPAAPPPRSGKPATERAPYRRFVSAEGYDILCGRDNHDNDRLTKTARGNDCWLHVGKGYAGSHVVVRIPKGKTPSLETLLDAAAIAVHFSKARGAEKAEVVYTLAKHVRKPKGSPPGLVVPHHTKTLQVRADSDRLRRLLDGGGAQEP